MESSELLELVAGGARAVIDPQGGRLASLSLDGVELLVTEGAKPTRWGSFPMIPWCGRLRDGLLSYDGEHRFPLTSPPHANHGFTHIRPWTVTGPGELRIELSAPDDEASRAWPFGGYAVQRFELDESSLLVSVEVHATGVSFPAMAGWHPWFRRDLGVGGPAELIVDLGGASIYEHAADGIPTGRLEAVPPGPWDACFVGLGADPVVRWPGAWELTVSSDFDHWVIYTEPTHALCVEPESGAPNEPNRAPRLVEPGAPLSGWMRLSWSAATA